MQEARRFERRAAPLRLHASWRNHVSLLVATTVLVGATAAVAQTPEELWQAAQQGDLAEVKRLVEAGVDADAKTRYGGTALGFAADKGALEIVEYLLSKGADPNVRDTFYSATPMSWTLMKRELSDEQFAIGVALVEAGSTEVSELLMAAIGRGRQDVVQATIGSERLSDEQAKIAYRDARRRGMKAIAELIEGQRGPFAEDAELALSAEQRARVVGEWWNAEYEMQIDVVDQGEKLIGQVVGQGPFPLVASTPLVFTSPGVPGNLKLTFSGEPVADRMQLEQGPANIEFVRKASSGAATAAGETTADAATPAAAGASGGDRAPRSAARAIERKPAAPWPSFRGASGSGVADGQGAPLRWNGETGEGVLWKTDVPGIALSSPIVWGGKVVVTTVISEQADETFRTGLYGDVDSIVDESVHSWQVWVLDLQTGEVQWKQVASEGKPKVGRHLKSSHANPTPATDGERIVVSFGSQGLYCYDFAGKLLWQRDLGVLRSGWFYDPSYEWGFSSSPILHAGKVIVQVDVQDGSFIAAFELATGEPVWRTERDEIPTWGTPAILPGKEGQPDEVVTNGPTIRGYDAATGEELWTLGPNAEVTVATPVIAGGMALVAANYPPARPIYAIRPGGRGDLTLPDGETSSDAIAWSHPRGGVYIPTPIAYDGVFYALNMNGRLAAYDLESGERIYRERVGRADSFSPSAVAADGHLYFTTETGKTYVVRAGEPFEVVATNEIDGVVMSTPAISDGVLVIRALGTVWGLAEKGGTSP